MKYFYAADENCFYHADIHGEDIPDNAIGIADEDYGDLMKERSAGRIIQAGADGRPEVVDPPPPPPPTITNVKAEAARRLAPTDWTVTRQAEGGKPIPEAVAAYRAAVRAASDKLEAMEPIPADYADDRHWLVLGA